MDDIYFENDYDTLKSVLGLLRKKISNKCSELPLNEDELIEFVKESFNLHDEDEDIINNATDIFIRLCALNKTPDNEIKLEEVILENKVIFREYLDTNNAPVYVKKLLENKFTSGKFIGEKMFSFGEVNFPVLYHGSRQLFNFPFSLKHPVNRLTFNPVWAKVYAGKTVKFSGKYGFIYAYTTKPNIKNIIQYNGNNIMDVYNKINTGNFPMVIEDTPKYFSNAMNGDELYHYLCSSEIYRNNINGILAPHNHCESQIILCKEGQVKLYLKNIYLYELSTKKVYRLV